MPRSPDLAHMSFLVPTGVKSRLQELADADQRGLSRYISLVLSAHVEQLKGRPGLDPIAEMAAVAAAAAVMRAGQENEAA